MSKIFRLFKEGAETYEDWHESNAFPYNSTHLQEINDPEGDNARNEITSIPSPFARIDIAKHAFEEVNKLGLEGSTIYHKTVSDVLDVGEIFFNFDKLSDIVEIIPWNPSRIQKLVSSSYKGIRFFGEALQTYMKSDKGTYNFDEQQNIYILNYKGDKALHSLDIIGATSPATMFFSSANNLSYLADEISFGTDHPFDSDYCPLYKRDFEYIKAWFVMRKSIPDFARKMPEVNKYLDNTLSRVVDAELRRQLINVSEADITQFHRILCSTENGQAFTVELFGKDLLMKVISPVDNSEFTIEPTTKVTDLPLVLPVESGNIYKDFKYTQGVFGEEAHAPYYDPLPFGKRKLPFDGRTQDYLTISDFLEDTIIRVPHKLNANHYVNIMTFTENDKAEEITYLIPLKIKFFEYFRAEDLQGEFRDNRLGIKVDKLAADSVLVTLQIPVKGHGRQKVVTYQRRYSGEADIEHNKGGIEKFDFDAFVMPLVRDNDIDRAFYTIGCISTMNRNYNMKFFSECKAIGVKGNCRNQDGSYAYKAVTYTVTGHNFDVIEVSNEDGFKGIIIPKFKQNLGTATFSFSIDVGTSNTHIAYQKHDSAKMEDFNYTNADSPICTVFIPTTRIVGGKEHPAGLSTEEELIKIDFLPRTLGLGKDSVFGFPTRTDLSVAHSYLSGAQNLPFELFNASMTYDRLLKLPYNDDKTNIKWERDEALLKNYISSLLLMIRNKVLLNDGNLSQTTITWFFPTSMPLKRKNVLKKTWDDLYKQFIGNGSTFSLTESSAPIYYLFKTQTTTSNMISIDIGGGTTDIAFAKQNKIESVSSFRFASNVLFENQLSPDNLNNGIVNYFKDLILDNIDKNDSSDEKELIDLISPLLNEESHVNPANMAAFLFSLKDNEDLKNLNKDVKDFNIILNKDENFKIVFILFYTAILYHIAEIIKFKKYDLPNIISFSGNGSKLLKVITSNEEDLADFSLMILKQISGKDTSTKLKIVGLGNDDNPKAVTCLGGLKAQGTTLESDPEISLRADGKDEIDQNKTFQDIALDENYSSMIVKSVMSFFDYVLYDIPEKYKYDYDDHFGVTQQSIKIARSCIESGKLAAYLEHGINLHIDEDPEEKLSQTLFFLPIKGVLDDISQEIAKSLK